MNDAIAARIEAFNRARDLPFHIDLLNRNNDRSSLTKTRLLQGWLRAQGLATRRIRCHFEWDIENLTPYHPLRTLAPMAPHDFVEVDVPETGKWVHVDPTFDIALKGAGFPVAEWDGLHATILAVKPVRIFSPEDSARLIAVSENTPYAVRCKYCEQNGALIDGLNRIVARCRHMEPIFA